MDVTRFFSLRHLNLHTKMTAALLDGATDDLLRLCPHGVNSVVWNLWHVARCEDVGVNRLVVDRPQVLDDGDWPARLNVPLRHYGTGMTAEEVADLSQRIDIAALRAYWAAVGQRTGAILPTLRPDDLDPPMEPERLRQVLLDEGVLGPHAGWVWSKQTYHGRTKGEMLGHLGLTHSYGHFYEAHVAKGLLGFPKEG